MHTKWIAPVGLLGLFVLSHTHTIARGAQYETHNPPADYATYDDLDCPRMIPEEYAYAYDNPAIASDDYDEPLDQYAHRYDDLYPEHPDDRSPDQPYDDADLTFEQTRQEPAHTETPPLPLYREPHPLLDDDVKPDDDVIDLDDIQQMDIDALRDHYRHTLTSEPYESDDDDIDEDDDICPTEHLPHNLQDTHAKTR